MGESVARQLANQKKEMMEQMIGIMAQADGWNERWKRLYAYGMYGERSRGHPGYAMIEQLDLAWDKAGEVFVWEVARTVVAESKLKMVQLVWLGSSGQKFWRCLGARLKGQGLVKIKK